MQSRQAALVIVSGAPASGKTTLAQRLSDDLRFPRPLDEISARVAARTGRAA